MVFGKSKKTTYMQSDEEREIVSLEASVTQLNADLAAERLKTAGAANQASTQKSGFITQGRKLERGRLLKITRLPEFKGREDLALKMALSDAAQSTPESIGVMLRGSPKKEKSRNQFAEHMAALGNPMIGPDQDTELGSENKTLELITKGAL